MRRQPPEIVPEDELLSRLLAENLALRERVRALNSLSYEDALTGVKNRRYRDDQLALELARSGRSGHDLSVVIVDVDDFKAVNDRYGHVAGDAALVWIARFLERAVRDGDVVCRTGGDEFTVILPETGQSGATTLVGRISALQEHAQDCAAAAGAPVTRVSIGAATWRGAIEDAQQLLDRADKAMYRAKRARRRRPERARRSA